MDPARPAPPAREPSRSRFRPQPRLVDDAALLLLAADLEVLAALDGVHVDRLALLALEAQHDLLRRLGLLLEHRLRLPAEPALLPVVPPLPLGVQRGLARLVLRHLVHLVVLALL